MHKSRWLPVLLLISIIPMLSGCWDQIEIQQRSFVVGLGIDSISEEELKPSQIMEKGLLYPQPHQILMTMEIPKTSKMAQGGQSGGGGGGEKEKPASVFGITGVNLSQAAAELPLRTSRQVFFGHLRVILIGEKYARKEGLKDILDFLFRDPEIQRGVPIFIVNGEAGDVLSISPPDDPLTSLYIENLMSAQKLTTRMVFVTLGDLSSKLQSTGNALIGRIRPAENEIISGGSAVIKNWKLAGYLGEIETVGAQLLMNKAGTFTIGVKNGSEWYGIRIAGVQRNVKPIWDGKDLTLEYSFQSEGDIEEIPDQEQILDSPKNTQALEKKVEASLKAAATATLRRLQQNYKTDAIGVGELIQKHWPTIWQELAPQWQQEFPRVKTRIRVEFRIRRSGVVL